MRSMGADIERFGSDNPWEATVGYCRVVRAGDHVHVAGTTATVDGAVVGVGDAAEQTRVALRIVAEALARAGASLTDVVRTRMFVDRHRRLGGRRARPRRGVRRHPSGRRPWSRSPR